MSEKTSYIENMTPEHKQAWIDALRSGKYEQGEGRLYKEETNQYCCLGVLADITESMEITNEGDEVNGNEYYPFYDLVDPDIWELNDKAKLTFNQIADILEAEGK